MQGQTQPNYFVMMVLQHEHEAKIKFFICLGKRNSSLLCWENTTSPTFNTQELKSIEYHKWSAEVNMIHTKNAINWGKLIHAQTKIFGFLSIYLYNSS